MKEKASLIPLLTPALLGVCVLLLAGLLLRVGRPVAPVPAPPAEAAGRYTYNFGAGAVYFVDTQTGRAWVQSPVMRSVGGEDRVLGERWVEVDTPVSHPKASQ